MTSEGKVQLCCPANCPFGKDIHVAVCSVVQVWQGSIMTFPANDNFFVHGVDDGISGPQFTDVDVQVDISGVHNKNDHTFDADIDVSVLRDGGLIRTDTYQFKFPCSSYIAPTFLAMIDENYDPVNAPWWGWVDIWVSNRGGSHTPAGCCECASYALSQPYQYSGEDSPAIMTLTGTSRSRSSRSMAVW